MYLELGMDDFTDPQSVMSLSELRDFSNQALSTSRRLSPSLPATRPPALGANDYVVLGDGNLHIPPQGGGKG